MKNLIQSLRAYILFTLLLGLLYPMSVYFVGQLAFRDQANGSLIYKENQVVGSKLIGQNFTSERYIQGRPSASNYDATSSGGTNLGPLSDALKNRLDGAREQWKVTAPASPYMLFTSASGLDPELDWASIAIQIPRVVKARWPSLDESQIESRTQTLYSQIRNMRVKDRFSLWSSERYNVLLLNLWLDQIKQ